MSPGTLLTSEPLDTSIKGAVAWRITYTSIDAVGKEQTASGIVIAPKASGEDRAVVTWSHGTTGIGDAGCPSAQPDPACELVTYFTPQSTRQIDYGIPGLQRMIDSGRVVVATDYQGLGTPGIHHYSVNRSNGRDALYIAHAARELEVGSGTRLLSIGWSQGGGSAAALAELGDEDFGDFELLGSALLSPGVTGVALAQPIGVGEALTDAKTAPDAHLVMTLAGHAACFPELAMSDLLTPLGIEVIETAGDIQPIHHINDTIGRTFAMKGAIMKVDQSAIDKLKVAVGQGTAGVRKPRGAILVCIDGFGGGIAVPVPWQHAYIDAVTKLGADITTAEYPDDDHFSLPFATVSRVQDWFDSLASD